MKCNLQHGKGESIHLVVLWRLPYKHFHTSLNSSKTIERGMLFFKASEIIIGSMLIIESMLLVLAGI